MSSDRFTRYTVLCIGGPLDGQWRTVDGRHFEALEDPRSTISLKGLDAVIEPFVIRRYDVEAVGLFGKLIHLAYCNGQFSSSRERDKAAIRAVFQRDVATYLESL